MSPKSSLEVMGSLNTAIDKWPLLQISYSSGGESYHWKFGQLAKFHGYDPNLLDVLIFIDIVLNPCLFCTIDNISFKLSISLNI